MTNDDKEDKPLLASYNKENNKENKLIVSISNKVNKIDGTIDDVNWYSNNVGFIEDMLFIVEKKDIYPKLFGIKLNSVLAKAIAGIVISGFGIAFRLFIPI